MQKGWYTSDSVEFQSDDNANECRLGLQRKQTDLMLFKFVFGDIIPFSAKSTTF